MSSIDYIRGVYAEVPIIRRNFTDINENTALYEGGPNLNDDEADYSAVISVKAVRLG